MNADRWDQVATLYAAALERDPAEREAFLRHACDGDDGLRRDVESLLVVHDDARHFLTGNAVDRLFVRDMGVVSSSTDAAGTTLEVRRRLGSYEIIALVGVGGMGEVYRARDVTLGRVVALKVLPHAFAHDAQRLARFEREARILAALNHPHIAQIYGIERSGGVSALVMEFVEGSTLAQLIARGRLPLDEAMPLARQIADALESAHEQGIIHRDLKPANIMVRPDGVVKVLDFGIAKPPDPDRPEPPAPATDTSAPAADVDTRAVFGTPAYISPEQTKGDRADKRTDTWAFGCVLYEMLSGRRAFRGDTVTQTIAAVGKGDVDWSALPLGLPAAVPAMLKRCLEKDRRRRISGVAAALSVIDDVLSKPDTRPRAPDGTLWRRATIAILALATAVVVVGAALWNASPRSAPRVSRFTIAPPSDRALVYEGTRNIAISGNGEHIAWVGPAGALVVRSLNDLEPRILINDVVSSPFFSSDGEWIGYFFGNGPLKKIPVTGGPATLLVNEGDNGLAQGASWAADGTIVFATNNRETGLQIVPPGSTAQRTLTVPRREAGESDHVWPEFLPDGRRVLFTITAAPDSAQSTQVAVYDLETGGYKVVLRGGSHAKYLATGHLVYVAGGMLYAIPFDLDRLQTTGTATPVVESLLTTPGGAADFDVAGDGTLVYAEGSAPLGGQRALAWVRRDNGDLETLGAPPRAYLYPRLSPDGTQVLLDVRDQDSDVWLWDTRRSVLTNLTGHPALDRFPLWMPDGRHFLFVSSRDEGRSAIYRQVVDRGGQPERLTAPSAEQQTLNAVTKDGRQLIFDWKGDLWTLHLASRQVSPLMATQAIEQRAALSPDERWLAYQIGDSPASDVFVRPWPNVEGPVTQVSSGGGSQARWSRDGTQLFFVTPQATVMVVQAGRGTNWIGSRPTPALIRKVINVNPTAAATFDVSPDGSRLLMTRHAGAEEELASPTIVLVQNWVEEMKRLVPTQ